MLFPSASVFEENSDNHYIDTHCWAPPLQSSNWHTNMGDNTINTYAYTIAIDPNKKIRGWKWSSLKHFQQKNNLTQILINALQDSGLYFQFAADEAKFENSFRFELTNLNNYHIHGTFEANIYQAHHFVDLVHRQCGWPKQEWFRSCYCTPTEINISHFDRYKNKDYDSEGSYIPNKSMLF